MATVSGTFTAVGLSAVLDVPALGEDITISLSGGATATVLLQRERVPYSGAWHTIRTYFGNVGATFRQERKNERYRFNCNSYTSGTVTYSVSDGDKVVGGTPIVDQFGVEVMRTTQAGTTFPGTLTVDGATTLTGAVTQSAAGTLASGTTIGNVTIANGSITDSSNAISFGNEALTTTGAVATGAVTTTGATSATGTATSAGHLNTLNNGSVPGTVTAVEYGDGYNHVTILTVTAAVFVPDVPANVEEVGALIYTFPTGVHRVNATHMDITAIALETNDPADCILACGSTLAAGDTVTFGVATDEDFIDGNAYDVTDLNGGTAKVLGESGDGTIFMTGDSKLFHINTAGTWTDGVAAGEATVTGTVTIWWTFLGT